MNQPHHTFISIFNHIMEKHKISELTSFSDRMKEFDENAKSFKVCIDVKLFITNGIALIVSQIFTYFFIHIFISRPPYWFCFIQRKRRKQKRLLPNGTTRFPNIRPQILVTKFTRKRKESLILLSVFMMHLQVIRYK